MKSGISFCKIISILFVVICSSCHQLVAANEFIGSCASNSDVCTLDYPSELKPWLQHLYIRTVRNRKSAESHPFIAAISAGKIPKSALLKYFEGMYWHGHLFLKLADRRPPSVAVFIASIGGRLNDGHSSDLARNATEASFSALIEALGGDFMWFKTNLDTFSPPYEWFLHNAQLRAAIYSPDFSWEVGIAAMNTGTEGTVPWYCGPLAQALEMGYGIHGIATEWLRVRGGHEAKEHGDNGFKVLSQFVNEDDIKTIGECNLFVDRLSLSMSQTLLDCGLRLAAADANPTM